MKLSELPQTPRQAYEAMTGKRPELLLTAERGHLKLVAQDAAINTRHYMAVFLGGDAEPHFFYLGSNN